MNWTKVCQTSDLIAGAGVAARVQGKQLALFLVPEAEQRIFAISNWDPFGKANVLSRGIVGHLQGEWVVASPLYKQHFSLISGACLEEEIKINTWQTKIEGDSVYINMTM
ncbi:nitrite reductase (NAD(P)H) small subunit [Marinomonas piezotolerans]|uniref:Nitrite reductase (NAD(P)H) small subunit n=1 Tax=Marinomonas piezotolerans TaxID=2213058 RepID=A0A370UDZ9_9GAMM|nr:nitrite reductase small subunit NirD [Marinomonas piezotolerans]RDL46006.1 nitrite reductase (NAD(P)H) small subunit [Marinomonas piezotolerans]